MLKKIAFSSILLMLTILMACSPGYSPEVQKLHDEVMEIHDEVMPEMGTIHKLKKELTKKLKNEKGNVSEENLENNIQALEVADEFMMDWMHQFKMPKNESDKNLIKYLEDQKIKITKVNGDMKTIIKNAKIANNTN